MTSPDNPKRARKSAQPKAEVKLGPPAKPEGRPSQYTPKHAEQAEKLCALGATDKEIADIFGVAEKTIYNWAAKHPEFLQALKTGKDSCDERVERSLYHRAVGYTFDSEKVFQFQGEVVRAKTREHVPPDTTAMIFWLKNRRKDLWRDKTEQEVTVTHKIQTMSDAELDRLIAEELGLADESAGMRH